jgi:DNA-binding transcriptional ArsR family regulator
VIHLEVSSMPPYRIKPMRQLRLTLPESDSVWPDEVWDGLPDAVRREALRRLAELLRRWLTSSERRS